MKRDIYTMALPNQARKAMLQTLRMIAAETATFDYVKNATREIEQERANINSSKRAEAFPFTVIFTKFFVKIPPSTPVTERLI